jgi:hypothetical protein
MRNATPDILDLIYKQQGLDAMQDQVPTATGHRFAPGVYMRSLFMPAGTRIIGHEHTTSYFNIVMTGRCRLIDGDKVVEIAAPYVFVSEVGSKKIAHVIEDTIWVTVHATDETDIPTLEAMLTTNRPPELTQATPTLI